MGHSGWAPGLVPRKRPRSKHWSTSGFAWNEVALPSRVVAYLERSATDCRAGERAADSDQFRLGRDLIEPSRHQPDLVDSVPRRRAGDRFRILPWDPVRELDRTAGRHDCDRDKLAMAQHSDLAPAGVWLGQDQFAGSTDGGNASPVIESAPQRL